jgi:ABC-type multidrug transport system fused ATPase/permease subunit
MCAATLAQAHEFIPGLRDAEGRRGYDCHVGERGARLSGGERQRIAIARAILKRAPIVLLDEATSSLDSEIEAAIDIAGVFRGRTMIAIAHRLSTLAGLDRLVVLDQGRIVEQGSHGDLLAAGGLYATLWRTGQMGPDRARQRHLIGPRHAPDAPAPAAANAPSRFLR